MQQIATNFCKVCCLLIVPQAVATLSKGYLMLISPMEIRSAPAAELAGVRFGKSFRHGLALPEAFPLNQTTIKQIALRQPIEIYGVMLVSRTQRAPCCQTTIKQIIQHVQAHHGRYLLALVPTESSWHRIRSASMVSLMILETVALFFGSMPNRSRRVVLVMKLR